MADRQQRRRRPLVLVVEDDPADWHLYGELLWYNGFDVAHATKGLEALRMASERPPDLFLLDLVLPGMDGLELCRRLRAAPATSHLPVIILSGRPAREVEDEARGAGATRYIEKPVSPLKVLAAVERLIGRPPPPGMEDPAEPPA